MTGPNVSHARSLHDLLRTGIVGAIFGATVIMTVHMASPPNSSFSLSLRVERDLVSLEVAGGAASPQSNSAAHVG